MRTDTIFYRLFLTLNSLLFELLGQSPEDATSWAEGYQFTAAEIKEKAFRFDGIFMPEVKDKPIYFVEVQFQQKKSFYWEFIAEINLYLNQYRPPQDWKAVAIFAQRSLEPKAITLYQQELIASSRILRIYLDELTEQTSLGIGILQLIVSPESPALALVPQLRYRAQTEIADLTVQQDIIELLGTILISKFSHLSRQEIEAMFLVNDLKQTKVYQEAKAEGKQEGRQNEARLLLLRLLSKRFGTMSDRQLQAIDSLSLTQLENLGEALLDFQTIGDLDRWLAI